MRNVLAALDESLEAGPVPALARAFATMTSLSCQYQLQHLGSRSVPRISK
jgi:hypothetical protein